MKQFADKCRQINFCNLCVVYHTEIWHKAAELLCNKRHRNKGGPSKEAGYG